MIYRQGLVQAGRPAVVEHRRLEDLWERKTPIISEQGGWDPNHDAGNITLTSSVKTTVDPLAYLVGPVQVAYGSDPAKTEVVDLAKYIDRKHKTVRSITGQIETDYGQGVYRVNSPTAQAVAGFLKDAGPQHLADVDITCRNHYAAIVVVPLDGKPIRRVRESCSFRSARSAGPRAGPRCPPVRESTASRATASASFPWARSRCKWRTRRSRSASPTRHLTKAVLLDINGMATPTPVEVRRAGGKLTVDLPANTMYLVLSK